MKYILLLLLLMFVGCMRLSKKIASDTQGMTAKDTVGYTLVDPIEEMALFDGRPADDAFREYVSKNLKYTQPEFDHHGTVLVKFVIEKDGSVSNWEITRGLHPELDDEALRVIRSSSGKWTPGKLGGKPVRTSFTFPVRFIPEADDISVQPDTAARVADDPVVYIVVDKMPLFDGRPLTESFRKYVAANLKNPLLESDYWGRVFVEFVIEKDSSVSNARVVRGLHPEVDAEALRIIRCSSGRWTPGKQRDRSVRVKCVWPVLFKW